MYACIILYSMILQDKSRVISNLDDDNVFPTSTYVEVHVDDTYFTRLQALHSGDTHHNLRTDLMEHIFYSHI